MVGVSRLELLTSRSQSARATNCAKPRTMNVLYHIYARIKSMKSFFQSHKRALCIFGPVLIGLIYILLCIANLNQSIWFDESYGAYLVRFKFSDIVHFTSVDVHPPLYYFLLKIWAHFLGFNAFSMRLLSTMLGAGAILFAFKWLKYKYGTKIAFVGSLALATSPFIVRYGQEMRMYTLVLLIFFAATYFMQIAIDTKKKVFWVIYAILIATGMWTHYFMAFAWCAQLVYILSIYKLDFDRPKKSVLKRSDLKKQALKIFDKTLLGINREKYLSMIFLLTYVVAGVDTSKISEEELDHTIQQIME